MNANRWQIGGVVVLLAAVVLLLGGRASGRPAPAGLPGLITSPAPWPRNTELLAARLSALGFPHFNPDAEPLHLHQHLDLLVNGHPVAVPANIGISFAPSVISVVHTEDDTGVIHIESSKVQPYYLGQFFDVWGLRFTSACLGSYCTNRHNSLRVYVNGVKYNGNPRNMRLADHQEIVVVFGPANAAPNPLPKTYQFPADL